MQTHCYFYFSGFVSLLNFDNDWRSSHELDAQAKVIVIFGRAVEAAGDVDVLWIQNNNYQKWHAVVVRYCWLQMVSRY